MNGDQVANGTGVEIENTEQFSGRTPNTNATVVSGSPNILSGGNEGDFVDGFVVVSVPRIDEGFAFEVHAAKKAIATKPNMSERANGLTPGHAAHIKKSGT